MIFRRHYLKDQTLTPLVVHKTDGQSLRGWLREAAKDGIVLGEAEFLSADGNTSLGGDTFIPHDRIDFVQVLAAQVGA